VTTDNSEEILNELISIRKLLEKVLDPTELLNQIANHPMNCYGEGFADAIQNGLVRGQRGIATYEN
jgi:hypothetical protein